MAGSARAVALAALLLAAAVATPAAALRGVLGASAGDESLRAPAGHVVSAEFTRRQARAPVELGAARQLQSNPSGTVLTMGVDLPAYTRLPPDGVQRFSFLLPDSTLQVSAAGMRGVHGVATGDVFAPCRDTSAHPALPTSLLHPIPVCSSP